jgi:hypothetical protein
MVAKPAAQATHQAGTGVTAKHVLSSSPVKGKKLANGAKVKVVLRS